VDAGRDTRETRLALCSNVVSAMRDEPSLSDWAAYCDLLLNAEVRARVRVRVRVQVRVS